jgi:autotransporter translocation and assembly factor TamB
MWNLRLNIRANNNIWIKNSDIDAEFKGDLFVERNVGITIPLGTLETIRRGKYYLLLVDPFDIKSGSMTFNNVAAINPDIDFVITKRLRPQAGQGEAELVEIHITGTLLEPKIDVAEGSDMTKEELLARLVAGSQIGQLGMVGRNGVGGSNFSKNLISSALPALSSFIGPIGGGFVEELEIGVVEEGTRQEYEVSVAKYISSSLYLRYSQRLSLAGRTIGVEYYLNDNVTFTISRGRIEGTENEGTEGISFDLNLNFEY